MQNKNITPYAAQPILRLSSGTQNNLLAELSEEALSSLAGLGASNAMDIKNAAEFGFELVGACAFDGDD